MYSLLPAHEKGGTEAGLGLSESSIADDQHFVRTDSNRSASSASRCERETLALPNRLSNLHRLVWISVVLNMSLLALVIFMSTREAQYQPRATTLLTKSMTPDGKSFPIGQLSWRQRFTPLPCGSSPSEAKAHGCRFDIIATAWLPPRCIDWELINEFNAYREWEYYKSPHGNETHASSDMDELGALEDRIWTTHGWHMAHCLFMWKKLNRALLNGRLTDAETVKQSHTDHCTMTILDTEQLAFDEISGYIETIYPPC